MFAISTPIFSAYVDSWLSAFLLLYFLFLFIFIFPIICLSSFEQINSSEGHSCAVDVFLSP